MTFSLRADFFVEGRPRPAGSKVSGVAHRRDEHGQQVPVYTEEGRLRTFTRDSSGAKGSNWRADVRAGAREVCVGDGWPLHEAISVDLAFYFRRPNGHFIAGKRDRALRSNAATWYVIAPDIDKLSRAVLDALKGIAWIDDAQVVRKLASKRYVDEREGARIVIAPID